MIGYRRVKLGDILEQYRVEHIVQDGVSYRQVTISQTGTVSVRGTKEGSKIGRKRQFIFDLKNYPNTLTFIRQGVQKGGIGIAPKEVDGCIATENMPMFTISDSVSTTYLKNYLKSIHFRRSLSKLKASGTAQKSIHERDLLEIELDIPDLETQIRIVKNLSDKVNLIQEVKSEIEKNKYKLNQLKQAYLQEAVQGKLTAKWRANNLNIEPASELLKRIEAEKQKLITDKKIKKEKPLPPIGEDEIPYELPENWIWCKLGNSGYTQTGSTPSKKQPNYYGNFIPFLGPADISNNWMKYPEEGLSQEGIAVGRLIAKNSLMMVCIGGSIGKCNINTIDVSCNQQINTITPILNEAFYVKICCQSPYFQNEVLTRSTGSATPIINKGKWENIIIPIAPIQEQQEIVEKVNAFMALCDELEQQIDNSQTQIEQLMQSCVAEALA